MGLIQTTRPSLVIILISSAERVLAGEYSPGKADQDATNFSSLIAIMLGRLEMSVDECIKTYTELSKDVFHKTRRIPIGFKGDLKERYDSEALEQAVKKVLRNRGVDEDTQLKNPQGTKVSVDQPSTRDIR